MTTSDTKMVRSSGNVFADLGLPDAEELAAKADLAVRINKLTGKLTQQQAAKRLGIPQPKVSKLRNYALKDISVEKLMMLLTKLDCDVQIVVRKRPARTKREARISVVAA